MSGDFGIPLQIERVPVSQILFASSHYAIDVASVVQVTGRAAILEADAVQGFAKLFKLADDLEQGCLVRDLLL